ncbi:putative oxidoreductase YvaA [Planctomycetes bacterium Poly30]|uniref:Putative oxidoreductase YvaA n=1 Tax=Saltatorellus ferox TaxID=2528018 RepID=A0A518ET44_9BACT|nr:putative oxidoreductase YvaA [Planctomycetes bacterium Poly30]
MSAVRVAVLGNSFANMIQLPALRWAAANGAPNEVVAIAGHGLEKAQTTAKSWGIPVATDRWEDIFDSPLPGGAVDLVIVSTPVHLHAPMVRAAIDADVAILCEKPFALDGAEARELRDAARGRLALIDHQTRWSPLRRELARRIAAGEAGAPWSARVLMNFASEKRLQSPYSWWYDEARGGGTLGAIGSHMLDGVMDQFGTRVESVIAELSTFVKERQRPDGPTVEVTADEAFWMSCRMHDGLVCQVESSLMAFGAKRDAGEGVLVEYSGSRGTFRLEGETKLLWLPHGGPPEVLARDPLPGHGELGMPPGTGFFPRVLPSYFRDVLQAVAEGRTELPGAADFDDAVHVMDVLDAARESAREGRRVPVRSDA